MLIAIWKGKYKAIPWLVHSNAILLISDLLDFDYKRIYGLDVQKNMMVITEFSMILILTYLIYMT
jgi:hypothetical protein